MFAEDNHHFNADELKAYARGLSDTAAIVQSCVKSPAWKLFRGLARKHEIEILQKDAYLSLEEFHGDRQGLKFLKAVIGEFEGYMEQGEEAVRMVNQLNELEKSTPLPKISEEAREG